MLDLDHMHIIWRDDNIPPPAVYAYMPSDSNFYGFDVATSSELRRLCYGLRAFEPVEEVKQSKVMVEVDFEELESDD